MQSEELQGPDYAAVKTLHDAMGLDYKMPDLASPLFLVRRGVRDRSGRIVGAAALKLQAEAYLWLDTSLSPVVRWRVISTLAHAVFEAAWRAGLDCLVGYLPPGLPPTFTKALSWLGVRKARPWEVWYKEL